MGIKVELLPARSGKPCVPFGERLLVRETARLMQDLKWRTLLRTG